MPISPSLLSPIRLCSSRKVCRSTPRFLVLWLVLVLCSFGAGPWFSQPHAHAETPSKNDAKLPGKTKPGPPLKRPIKKLIQKIKKEKPKKKFDPNRLEWGALPALSGSVDTGFGFGLIANLAKFQTGYYPYKWRLTLLWYMTVKNAPGGGSEFPFHDDYIRLDLPGLANNRLRLNIRAGFRRFTTSGYYGLGNASSGENVWEQFNPETQTDQYILARRRYQYDRIYPYLSVKGRILLQPKLFLLTGMVYYYNWFTFYEGSKLKEDIARSRTSTNPNDPVRNILVGTENHAQIRFNIGLLYDNRDNEFTPKSGGYHEISVRGSPGPALATRYVYGGINATSRWFVSLYKEYFVLAARVMGDALFGQVPFYELTSYGGLFDSDSFGGSGSIRGIRTQRFHGKVKLLANLELRNKWFDLWIFNVGTLLFVDVGHVWSDYQSNPDLDGEGFNPHLGLGGGLRLQWGKSFIIRADFAWSQDQALGFYININHIY